MGNILSALFDQVMLGSALGCIFGDGNYIHLMEANLKDLKKTMKKLQELRVDIDRRVSTEEDKGLQRLAQVQGWRSRVELIQTEVNDLLDAESTETGRLCLFEYCSNDCISSCEYGKKVSKKLEEVKELLSEGVFEEVVDKGRVRKVKEKDIQTDTMVGLDSMVDKAWNSLMKGEHTKTLGLYGMGGVGKTTLLARINNKFVEDVNEFDVVIWVVVSKDLQNESIQNQILGRLRNDKEWKGDTEEEKASSIYDILSRKKKFVLLLDDLWNEVDLNKIGVPRPTCDNGAKIVFTTRSKEVCRDMKADDELKVECLSPAEAWELFQTIVGEVRLKRHQDIPKLARQIAEKCCGLPLALNVIGKAMARKENVHEWRHAANVLNLSSHKFPGMEENILSILKFSYDGLRDENVKSCFLYCSLFPEDYEIKKEELIEYWICEGFVDGNRDEDGSNNQGHDIIGLLVRAHLLMDVDGETTVKLHDVLREMALWIGSNLGEGEKILVKSSGKLHSIPNDIKWEVVKRISLMNNQIEDISCCSPCPNLSTLILGNNDLRSISSEFFQFMPALIILDLSKNGYLCELPESFSSLTSLHYLNLSHTGIESLPMKGLRKLINLDLEDTLFLESIDGIGTSIPNLQVLKLYGSRVFVDARSMKELQLLEHLKILTATVNDALILESIQGMERLASCLQILFIWGMSAQVVRLNTVALGGLRELAISDSKISEIKIDWESKERTDLLCPSSPNFKHLSTVFTYCLEGPKDLTWLLLVPNLRNLKVIRSSSIEEIINREKGMSISNLHPDISLPFQKLERLQLGYLPGLKRICSNPPSLPKLKELNVNNCPKLPKAATEFTSASGSNDMNITQVREGDESEIEALPFQELLLKVLDAIGSPNLPKAPTEFASGSGSNDMNITEVREGDE